MSAEIGAKVIYFERLVQQLPTMSGEERARARKELVEYYDSLSPTKRMAQYAAGGAVVAGILPGIGWVAGGLIGGVIGAAKAGDTATMAARERLGQLINEAG